MSNRIDYFDSESLKKDLKGRTARGGAITAVAQVVSILLTFGTLPILADLLDPEDYGLLAMVTVFTGFAAMFVDAGFTSATIQKNELTHQQSSNLLWISTAIGTLLALVMAAIAPVISWIYQEPRLVMITLALASTFPLTGLALQHQALLRRALRQKHLAYVTIGSQVCGVSLALAWAWNYQDTPHDYWALVLMTVTASVTRAVGMWLASGWRPSFLRRGQGTRELVVFGANLTGFNFINYFSRNADNVLIGWWWGAASLGVYERAYKLFLAPLMLINAPLAGVIVPSLSRLSNEEEKLENAYLRVLKMLALIAMPVSVMVLVTADYLVLTLLGPDWVDAAPILRWLALVGILQPISNSTGWLFTAKGKTAEMLKLAYFSAPVTLASFVAGLPWGANGVAAAYAISGIAFRFPILLYWLKRHKMVDINKIAGVFYYGIPASLAVATTSVIVIWILTNFLVKPSALLVTGSCVTASVISWSIAIGINRSARSLYLEQLKAISHKA